MIRLGALQAALHNLHHTTAQQQQESLTPGLKRDSNCGDIM